MKRLPRGGAPHQCGKSAWGGGFYRARGWRRETRQVSERSLVLLTRLRRCGSGPCRTSLRFRASRSLTKSKDLLPRRALAWTRNSRRAPILQTRALSTSPDAPASPSRSLLSSSHLQTPMDPSQLVALQCPRKSGALYQVLGVGIRAEGGGWEASTERFNSSDVQLLCLTSQLSLRERACSNPLDHGALKRTTASVKGADDRRFASRSTWACAPSPPDHRPQVLQSRSPLASSPPPVN